MTRRDIIIGLILGELIGIFLLPVLSNTGLAETIPARYWLLLVALPLAAAAGVWVAGFLGKIAPVIWQFAKFGLVGVSNTAVDLGVYYSLIFATGYEKGLPLAIINVFSFACAVTNSFFWNERWVFAAEAAKKRGEFVQFAAVSVSAALISSAFVGAFTQYLSPIGGLNAEQWAGVAKVIAIIFVLFWNFFGYKFIVFARQ